MDELKSEELKNIIHRIQLDEITGHHIYKNIATVEKAPENKKLFSQISTDELEHYNFFKNISGTDVKPNKFKIWRYTLSARILGVTFTAKLMEKNEVDAQMYYSQLLPLIPDIKNIMETEETHEHALIDLIKEEALDYIGSVVLGLNDALVELTGALAGFSFALQNTKLIAVTGLITGIAASFSMAASQYLSVKTEGGGKNATKSALYTGLAYVITVATLITPFLCFSSYVPALIVSLLSAVFIILIFNYYISIAKDYNFKRRFIEMSVISLGVAGLTFVISILIKTYLGVDL